MSVKDVLEALELEFSALEIGRVARKRAGSRQQPVLQYLSPCLPKGDTAGLKGPAFWTCGSFLVSLPLSFAVAVAVV